MNTLAQLLAKKKAALPAPTESASSLEVTSSNVPPDDVILPQETKAEESTVTAPVGDSSQPATTLRRLLSTPKPAPKTPNVIDSNRVAALLKPELTVEAIANSDGNIPDPNAGARFQLTLDLLDARLTEIGGGLDAFNIDSVRSIISRIMIDLKEHPDYDGLYLGDRDVHNIMKFMYRVKERAQESNERKTVAAEKKVVKHKKTSAIALALDDISMENLSL